MAISISVIVLNYNSPSDTVECVRSLMRNNYDKFEVILIDNGSTDNSKEILKELESYPNLTFIQNETNLGFAAGNNVGIKIAKSDYILLLNNDTIVEDDFMEKLAEKIQIYPDAAAIGPKIYYYQEPHKIWFAGGKLDWLLKGGVHIGINETDNGQCDGDREVEYVTGCALLMNRRTIEAIGMLDERFFIYYEDTDWCLRARKAGYRCIYVSEPVLWHKVGGTMAERGKKVTERQLYLGTRNKILSMKKICSKLEYISFLSRQLLIFTPAYLLSLLLRREGKLVMAYIRGLRDGIRM